MTLERDYEAFARVIEALRPALDRLVIIGGWAHRLYRNHPLAQEILYEPLMTRDADLALPLTRSLQREDLRGRLLAHGFRENFLGDDRPPITQYRLGDDDLGFYVEFVTPLFGSEVKRHERRDVTTTLAGISAQKLRYLEVLLIEPWTLPFGFSERGGESGPTIKLANPTAFIAQKILVSGKRRPSDRAKDVLYIHDTLELFGRSIPDLHRLWVESLIPRLSRQVEAKIHRDRSRLFTEITDTIRDAALMARNRPLSPASLLETCQAGINLIFA